MASSISYIKSSNQFHCLSLRKEKIELDRLQSWRSHQKKSHKLIRLSKRKFSHRSVVKMSASTTLPLLNLGRAKKVWIWTESKEVMNVAVERGWNTFIFSSDNRKLSDEWSSIALIDTLFMEEKQVTDGTTGKVVASVFAVSTPEELQKIKIENEQTENIVLDFLDWKSIPAENLVAALQGSAKTVFAISNTPSEAKLFLEALEHGLGGILKAEDIKAVLDLKEYIDKRTEESETLSLTEATITRVQMVGMGDRVCVDLCSLMRHGEGLLVGSFARGLFLVHSECLESNYIESRPFRVNAVRSAVPGGKTCYLSELRTGREVLVVDQKGRQRTAVVGRVKIEKRPLILVEAKLSAKEEESVYSIILQNAETVALVTPHQVNSTAVPVTSLKLGDQVLIRLQGGARHTGIEIQDSLSRIDQTLFSVNIVTY